MKLKCNIHGIEFNIVQGATFSDNYNETLDSGTIIIDHIEKIDDLRPYDDVFIYEENADFFGYANASNANAPLTRNYFYKHLLIDRYSEERLNPIENIFKYKIELFSETKKLETICLPNISITEPLEYEKKISVWEYLNMYVEQYSPKIKIQVSDIQADNTFKWDYVRKYKILPELESVFSSCFPPDFTLNTPNLRDVLSKLMQVKDMIPYVQDDFICGLDITKRTGDFNVNGITTITSNMSSAEYVDNLRRNYSNALSQDKTCRLIEHMGFRNSSSALMTLENMRLETRYPIYKINRILMCYYKKVKIKNHLNSQDEREAIFLCKQDITPLVVL